MIVVSAKAEIDHKVDMLLGGAADYVTKPFDIRELMARIAVQLRGSGGSKGRGILTFEEITIDLDTFEAYVGEAKIHLTPTEFAVLKQLIKNPSQVVTKARILDAISEDTPDCTESSLKIHISNLRKKLKSESGKDYIESVWGIGFKMRQDATC